METAKRLYLPPFRAMMAVKEKLLMLKVIGQAAPSKMTVMQLYLPLLPMTTAAKKRLLGLRMMQQGAPLLTTMMRLYLPLQLMLMVAGPVESGCCWMLPRFQWQHLKMTIPTMQPTKVRWRWKLLNSL